MVYFFVMLGLGILSVTVSMAVGKKATLPVRIASLIAIALMILTVIICIVMVSTDTRVPVDESVLIVGAPVEVKKEGRVDPRVLTLMIIMLVVVFLVIAFISMHQNRKYAKKDDGKNLIL